MRESLRPGHSRRSHWYWQPRGPRQTPNDATVIYEYTPPHPPHENALLFFWHFVHLPTHTPYSHTYLLTHSPNPLFTHIHSLSHSITRSPICTHAYSYVTPLCTHHSPAKVGPKKNQRQAQKNMTGPCSGAWWHRHIFNTLPETDIIDIFFSTSPLFRCFNAEASNRGQCHSHYYPISNPN